MPSSGQHIEKLQITEHDKHLLQLMVRVISPMLATKFLSSSSSRQEAEEYVVQTLNKRIEQLSSLS